MARKSPAQKLKDIRRAIEAWERHAPDSVFYGMTLEQFKAAMRPSLQFREDIDHYRRCLKTLPRQRDGADTKAMRLIEGAKYAIGGDPKFGQDSLLYGDFGYVRKSARRKRTRMVPRKKPR
jgi:hypothetical protein